MKRECEVLDIWTYPEDTHLSIVVAPTTSLLLVCVSLLCYVLCLSVVLCVVLALAVYVSYLQLPLSGSRARSDCLV